MTEAQENQLDSLRCKGDVLMDDLIHACNDDLNPDPRLMALAKTKLEEAMMCAERAFQKAAR